MKKLMFAAVAALAMVGAANAGATTGYAKFTNYAPVDPSPSSETTGKYSCYLIENSLVQSAQNLETWLKNNGGITRENIAAKGEAVSWSAIAWNTDKYETTLGGSTTLGGRSASSTYAIVLAAMTSESSDFGYEIIKGVMDPEIVIDFDDATFTFNDAAAGTVKWTAASVPVPEPTSGLLLLLGVAGLALKRKRA